MKDKYKRYEGWCDGCDCAIVASGTKCKYCGARNEGTKIKKKEAVRKIIKELEKEDIDGEFNR
jgi:hypothetical protein